ncbi:alpha/beta hydrolase [Halioxenophilus sp. WMMB6]|uniref:alpha/beta fold hydrolase n=1 Tax=Halioxenophilus sp. WMMB6 TaxID=3073815 RepID=UPI00295E47FC|nr:alpha/beta hydrolase [Halioxenophilus sp. WMMB6]
MDVDSEATMSTTRPVVSGWRQGTVAGNGVDLVYEERGPADGPVVLLITGLSWQLIHWPEEFCQPLLDAGYRVIRFDNRDAGLSSKIPGRVKFDVMQSAIMRHFGLPASADYTLHHMVDDVIALLDGLQVSRAHLVGASMGGMIAQLCAVKVPGRVASLTSMMSSTNHPSLPTAEPEVLKALFAKSVEHSTEAIVERSFLFHQLIGSPAYPTPDSELRELCRTAFERSYRPGGVMRQLHAIIATGSFEHKLLRVKAPTQIIHGDADRMVPLKCGRRTARAIDGAKLEVIPGMGHDFPSQLLPKLADLCLQNFQCA